MMPAVVAYKIELKGKLALSPGQENIWHRIFENDINREEQK